MSNEETEEQPGSTDQGGGFAPPSAPGAQQPRQWDASGRQVPSPPPIAVPPPAQQPPPPTAPPSAQQPPPPTAPPSAQQSPPPSTPVYNPSSVAATGPVYVDPNLPPPLNLVAPGGSPPAPQNSMSTASIVLGISGLAVWMLSAGLFGIISLPCSILAWIFGNKGLKETANFTHGQARDLAKAGQILGIIGVVLGALAIIGWILFFVIVGSFGEFDRQGGDTEQGFMTLIQSLPYLGAWL